MRCVVGLAVCITSQTTNHANRAIEQVLANDKDVVHEVDFIPLLDSTGRREQRNTFVQWCSFATQKLVSQIRFIVVQLRVWSLSTHLVQWLGNLSGEKEHVQKNTTD